MSASRPCRLPLGVHLAGVYLALILASGLALRLIVAWTDTATLVSKALPDDAFYYFVIVENALAGRGITFDGLAPTNGFHPLWALILAPIFWLAPHRDMALHVALTLSALFDAGTIYLAYRAGRAVANRRAGASQSVGATRRVAPTEAGLFAAALYALNPRLILENINGLETAVSTFFFALTACFYVERMLPPPIPSPVHGGGPRENHTLPYTQGRAERENHILPPMQGKMEREDHTLPHAGKKTERGNHTLPHAGKKTERGNHTFPRAGEKTEKGNPTFPRAGEKMEKGNYTLPRVRGRAGVGDYALLGVLAALAVWARTDAIFLTLVIGLDQLRRRREKAILPLLVMGAVWVALLVPWLLWNWRTFGTPIQTSGVAVPYVVRTYLFELSGTSGWMRVAGPVIYLASVMLTTLFQYALLPLGILLAYGLWRLTYGARSEPAGIWSSWAVPLVGASLIVLFHTFGRFFLRGWYVVPWVFVLCVLAGALLARLAEAVAERPRMRLLFQGGSAAIIVLVLIAGGLPLWTQGMYPWQASMLEAAQWASQELPSGTVLGAFNAGILSWFSAHPVLNLDGVVSGPAWEAVRGRQLLAFVRRQGIDVILDWQSSVESTYAPFFEEGYEAALEPVARFPAPAGAGNVWTAMLAYRVRP